MTVSIRQKLPVDIQAFEIMREDNYRYVDKTQHIYRMVTEGRYYFLSRPRRFGKSLLVSTLKCLFQGRKELFEGLWIADQSDWAWQSHPVLVIDFSEIANETPEHLKLALEATLEQQAAIAGISLKSPLLQSKFQELVLMLARTTDMPAVVLIDEYDKPILDHLGKNLETAKANRDVLKSFFGVLKSGHLAPILRFVFLTGISRFSKVSIFSELNNLLDLSMDHEYADLLGYTQHELEVSYQETIHDLAIRLKWPMEQVLDTLARQYNGYRFSERDLRVYNPFSILRALHHQQFKDYWFESATPGFLVHLLKQMRYNLPAIEGLQVSRLIFNTFELDSLQPEALLFQAGYVTIADVHNGVYTLDYPNQEVKRAFTESLLFAFSAEASATISSSVLNLPGYLAQENFEAFFETMQAIFASIPYDIESQRDEAYFHTIFYLMMSASGLDAQSSVLTSVGRIDLAVIFVDKVYIIEFKCNQSAQTAVQQVRNKHYADRYRGCGKKIWLMGVNFASETRNVTEWRLEENTT